MAIPPQENTASYWIKLGNSLANSGRCDEATKAYDRSLGLDPKNSECWNNRGIVLFMQNMINGAILSFERPLLWTPKTQKPGTIEVWFFVG